MFTALILAGCSPALMYGAGERPVVDTSVQSFKPFLMDERDTCATQRAIAAHNSVYDTLKEGKERAYCAPCDCPKKYEGVFEERKARARVS